MKRIDPISLLAFLFLFVAVQANAQSHHKKKKKKSHSAQNSDVGGGTTTYDLLDNDPENAPNFHVSLFPVYGDLYTLNYNLGYEAKADYRWNNKFDFGAFYKGSYLDRFETTENSPPPHGVPEKEKGVSGYGFFGTFFFRNELTVEQEDIYLKSRMVRGAKTNYYMEIPAKRLELWGIRAGYEVFNSYIYSTNGNIKWLGHSPDSAAGSAVEFDNPRYAAMMQIGQLSFGICRTRISDVHVKTTKYGVKAAASVSELYADFTYGTSVTFGNMLVSKWDSVAQEYNHYAVWNVNDKTPKSLIGFRVGYSTHVNDKFKVGSFTVELGMRAGPKAGFDNFYLMLKYGLGFSAHAGNAKQPDEEDTE